MCPDLLLFFFGGVYGFAACCGVGLFLACRKRVFVGVVWGLVMFFRIDQFVLRVLGLPRRVWAMVLTVVLLVSGVSVARVGAAPTATSGFTALSPAVRVFDSRRVLGGRAVGVVPAGGVVDVLLSDFGVPSTASGVSINVTVDGPQADGFVTVWPSGIARPDVSVVNFKTGAPVANSAIVKVGANGRISFFAFAATDLIVDVSGYFGASQTGFEVVSPRMLVDKRTTAIAPGLSLAFQIRGVGGVPADATGVALNVTAVSKSASPGFLSVSATTGAAVDTSSVNFGGIGSADEVASNLVITDLSASGEITVAAGGASAGVQIDVYGWFVPGANTGIDPVVPYRLLDTRQGAATNWVHNPSHRGIALANTELRVPITADGGSALAPNVTGVVATVTVTQTGGEGKDIVWSDATIPAANVFASSWKTGETSAATVVLGFANPAARAIRVLTTSDAHVIVDVVALIVDSTISTTTTAGTTTSSSTSTTTTVLPEVVTPYRAAVSALGPKVYWHLDELGGSTAVDSAGGDDPGVIDPLPTNAPPVAVALPALGSAAVAGHIQSAPVSLSGNAVSLEFWGSGPANRNLGRFGGLGIFEGNPAGAFLYFLDGEATTALLDSSPRLSYGEIAFQDATWRHYVITHDGTTARFYIDGQLRHERVQPLALGDQRIDIGSNPEKSFDEVALYSKALSVDEIQEHFALGNTGRACRTVASGETLTPYQQRVTGDGAVGLWPMGYSGSVLWDVVGCHNLTNATTTVTPSPGQGDIRSVVVPGIGNGNGLTMNFKPAKREWASTAFPAGSAVSLEFWSKGNGANAVVARLGSLGFSIGEPNWRRLYMSTGAGTSDVLYGTGPQQTNFDTDVWRHYVVTHDGSKARFYLDGVLQAERVETWVNPNSILEIGASTGRSYVDLAVYRSVLTPAAVREHYAIGLTGRGCRTTQTGETLSAYEQTLVSNGAVSVWPMGYPGRILWDVVGCHNMTVGESNLIGPGINATDEIGSLQINGVGAGTIADVSGLSSGSPVTLEFWSKGDGNNAWMARLGGLGIGIVEPSYRFLDFATGNGSSLFNAVDFTTSDWRHYAVTYDGNTARFYVDGIERAARQESWTFDSKLYFGESVGKTYDEVALYTRALTPSEIQNHYQIGSGTLISPPTTTAVATTTTPATTTTAGVTTTTIAAPSNPVGYENVDVSTVIVDAGVTTPRALTVDQAGLVEFVEVNGASVKRVQANGTLAPVPAVASGTPLSRPSGVASTSNGDVFVVDEVGVRRISQGVSTVFVDAPLPISPCPATLQGRIGMFSVDADVASDVRVRTAIRGQVGVASTLTAPIAIASDQSGNICL